MKELEKSSVLNNPEMVVVIGEGMFFFHLRSDLPEIFGFVSRSILRKLCSDICVKQIDNVFDKVEAPPIKDNERNIRAQGFDSHTAYEIFGPFQKRPTNFLGGLHNNTFQQT